MNCFGVLNLSEFYKIELFIPILSIFISVSKSGLIYSFLNYFQIMWIRLNWRKFYTIQVHSTGFKS